MKIPWLEFEIAFDWLQLRIVFDVNCRSIISVNTLNCEIFDARCCGRVVDAQALSASNDAINHRPRSAAIPNGLAPLRGKHPPQGKRRKNRPATGHPL
jgi:hypothetical protein